VTERAHHLAETADRQIADLAERLSAAGDEGLRRPCPGRAKLGDATVGAVAAHTTDNYCRIAGYVAAIRAGDEPRHPAQHGPAAHAHKVALDVLLVRLAAVRDGLATIGQLTDEQLNAVPTAGGMKFADGERTLEQIILSLLKHQDHQVAAIAAGLS
jgi:hypothetical protein